MIDLKQLIGKSIYIWDIDSTFGGDIRRIAFELKAAQFQSVMLHSTRTNNWKTANRIALTKALQAVGVHVFGGAAIYGANPASEGQQAAAICKEFNLPGFVFDAEAAFDAVRAPDSAAARVLREFKQYPELPVGCLAGWCWWAFFQSWKTGSAYHPKSILWAATADAYGDADFGVPMAYWSWGDEPEDAIRYLNEVWRQWRMITDKPIIPAGRAYVGDGGRSNPEAMIAFEKRARELGAPGITWWVMQQAINASVLPGVWQTLIDMQPFGAIDPPPPAPANWWDGLSTDARVLALCKAHPELKG